MSHPLNFGGKLSMLRRAAGLKIADAEEKSGMKPGRWEDLESGDHEPRAGDFVRAMIVLNVRDYRVFTPEDFDRCE